MRAKQNTELKFLWHPGTKDIFSGYGLVVAPAHLVGIVMVDRPRVADPGWLAEIERTFGEYQLTAMTKAGERGMVCQMHIAPESERYLKTFDHSITAPIREVLLPLLENLPAATLAMRWDPEIRFWVSVIVKGGSG